MKGFMIDNYLSGRIIFGMDAVRQLGDADRWNASTRVLIVTDRGVAATGNVAKVAGLFEEAVVYQELEGEPSTDAAQAAVDFCRRGRFELVIGIGGGSTLDTAKVVAALNGQSLSVTEALGRDQVGPRTTGLGLIPTTAGTGSEATPNSIFLDSLDGVKKAVISKELIPDWVILDPGLTVSLPATITASTGMDALCHCIESLLSVNANPISAAYSYQGVKLLSHHIWRAVENGADLSARGNMLLGSFLGGLALTQAGTTAVHALAYPLGKRGVPHGVANGLLLGKVLEYNLPDCQTKMASLAAVLENGEHLRSAAEVVAEIAGYVHRLPVPKSLKEVGINEASLPELAAEAMEQERLMANNPKALKLEEVCAIYQGVFRT